MQRNEIQHCGGNQVMIKSHSLNLDYGKTLSRVHEVLWYYNIVQTVIRGNIGEGYFEDVS